MATLNLVKTEKGEYYLQGTGDSSRNADFSLFDWDGEGGDPFAFGNQTWELVDLPVDFRDRLFASGHAIKEVAGFTEPVTLSGDYLGKNGFWYSVAWNNGRSLVSEIGYSAEYKSALREAESLFGVWEQENDSQIENHILKALGIDGAFGVEYDADDTDSWWNAQAQIVEAAEKAGIEVPGYAKN